MRRRRRRGAARGFTLIELMVAVAVVGILAAIAYPSYLGQIQKSRRADARAALVAAAQALERFYSERSTYAGATLGSSGVYPAASQNGYYTLSITAQSAAGFTLAATPTGNQASDACDVFTYDQTGTKGNSGGTLGAASCW
ncbi:MAG: type IV pilin protein [Burkholderiales bacterium]|nr:type IV pilin protein [Burkholderiales bacterium]MDE2394339.1 type IV pilin protein [Burkholderiales bacterium]